MQLNTVVLPAPFGPINAVMSRCRALNETLLTATRQGFISPESFTFHESALVLAIVVLGGMGSQLGVALAALAMIGGFELFRGLDQYRMLVFGVAMVLLMIWRPRGLIGHRAPTVFLKHNQAISSDLVKEGH